jgi:hypothetical protein
MLQRKKTLALLKSAALEDGMLHRSMAIREAGRACRR